MLDKEEKEVEAFIMFMLINYVTAENLQQHNKSNIIS